MKEFIRQLKESWAFNKQTWRLFRKNVNFRYWLLLWLNTFVAMRFVDWLGLHEANILFRLAVVLLYFAVSPLALLLWVPLYIKHQKPNFYHGAICAIGEWIGEPYKFTKTKNKHHND